MAGRIPEVQQSVAPVGPRVSQPTLGNEADASPGIRAIGQFAVNAAEVASRLQAEADAVRLTETLVELERRTNDRLSGKELGPIDAAFEGTKRRQGFLETRGVSAGEASAEVMNGLDEDVKELAEKLLPRQREAFLSRARQMQLGAERRVETHVAQESDRAKVDAIKAAQSETLRSIANSPLDQDWQMRAAFVEDAIRSLATSPEAAKSEIRDWQGKLAIQQISSLLSEGAVNAASNVFAEKRSLLGPNADEVSALLQRARAGQEKQHTNQEATAEVSKWVKAATPAGGYVDSAKVLERLQSLKADDPRREAIEVEVRQQLQVDDGRRRADIKRHQDIALRADLDGHHVPGTTFQFLREFDPDFLRGLKNERDARWRRYKTDSDGSATEKAAARHKQAEDDEFLRLKFASLTPEEQQSTTPQEFAKKLAAETPDFSPSRNGYAAAEKVRADTVQRLGKGDLATERAFVAEAEREVLKQITVRGKVDPRFRNVDVQTVVSGRAAELFRAKRDELKREPTEIERQQWLGELKVQSIYKSGLFRDEKGPAVLSPQWQAPLKPPTPAILPPVDVPQGVIQMRFPNGKVYPVDVSKIDVAKKKGAVEVNNGR